MLWERVVIIQKTPDFTLGPHLGFYFARITLVRRMRLIDLPEVASSS